MDTLVRGGKEVHMVIPVKASPTKEFFVNMITRDIDLTDAILDLLDNTIDGARRSIRQKGQDANVIAEDLSEFEAEISVTEEAFQIKDNCGGITINDAAEYAFHFGRRADTPDVLQSTIGFYGIGMKRAFLKMGDKISVQSSTEEEAFTVNINVSEWLKDEVWDFSLLPQQPWPSTGSIIQVEDLYPGVSKQFGDNTFISNLINIIARDYSFILDNGFRISVNGVSVKAYKYQLREGKEIKPAKITYEEEGGLVTVEISAGMADVPLSDISAEYLENLKVSETDFWGWFVVCNNRVVLAADKSDRTIWGDERFARWHPQYNGFMGIVKFFSEKPGLLPWTTTKRDIDESSQLYQRAVVEMKQATRPWINYTTERKTDLERARGMEKQAISKPIEILSVRDQMELPKIVTTRERETTIQYHMPLNEVNKVKRHMGDSKMSNSEVGRRTFEYFIDHELME